MPRIKNIGKEKIVETALIIVQTEGMDSLNARKIAKMLNCSTQPIYSEFKSMDDLKNTLKIVAENKYRDCVQNYVDNKKYSAYLNVGMGYLKFAKEHKGLFNYLYMQPKNSESLLFDDINANQIESILMEVYHFSKKQASEFHLEMAIYTFGLACALNLNLVQINEDEIADRLKKQFSALMALYQEGAED